MKNNLIIKMTLLTILSFHLNSCLRPYSKNTCGRKTKDGFYIKNVVLDKNTVWNGSVIIDTLVVVPKGITLTIKPGTVIKFVFWDKDGDKNGDGKIIVKGNIIAEGTDTLPIIFTSNEKNKKIRDWYSVQMLCSNRNIFKYCKVEYSVAGFEAECSQGYFSHNIFTNNIRGMRFARCNFVVKNSLFKNNIYGLWFCDMLSDQYEELASDIQYNIIKENTFGIFCKYDSPKTKIMNNNIYDNKRYNMSFSIWVKKDINAANNFWGEIPKSEILEKIFDKRRNLNIGEVIIEPYLSKAVNVPENI